MDTEKLHQLADNLREQETVADEFRMQRWMDADNYNKIMICNKNVLIRLIVQNAL